MKRITLWLLITVMLAVCLTSVQAAEVVPEKADPASLDLKNGTYCIKIREFKNGYIQASLYTLDLYSAEAVKNLAPGDKMTINGVEYTVSELVQHESGIEIYPEEELYGYLALWPYWGDDAFFYAVQDDWSPCTWVKDVTIPMPLPNDFAYVEYVAGEEIERSVSELEDRLNEEDGVRWFTQYNTNVTFKDGLAVKISHSDYPEGPEEEISAEEAETSN